MFTNLIVINYHRKNQSNFSFIGLMVFGLFLSSHSIWAQDYFLPVDQISNLRLERAGVYTQEGVHAGVKPVFRRGTDVSQVAGLGPDSAKYYYRVLDKVFSEHLIELDKPGLKLNIDPLFDFGYGQEIKTFNDDDDNLVLNTRGFTISGQIGKKVFFHTDLRENQGRFPSYMDVFVDSLEVVPGSGRIKPFKETGYDYSMANGYVGIEAAKWLSIQFGHGKDFIGHGYRSVILSDNAFNYPFAGYALKSANGKWMYKYQIAGLQKLERLPLGDAPESLFKRKYMSSNYLSYKIRPNLEIGLYESMMWKSHDDSTGTEPFNANALNPIPLVNTAIFGLQDPENNALLGLNMAWQPWSMLKFYGQLMVDDFETEKHGYQIGTRIIGLVNRVDVTLEYNVVSESAYASENPLQGYTHFNQPMAHPLGAGFEEFVAIATYAHKRWYGQLKFIGANYSDSGTDPLISDKNEIVYSKNTVAYQDLQVAYIFNPTTNMQLYAGITNRKETGESYSLINQFWYFGFRTRLSNVYSDF